MRTLEGHTQAVTSCAFPPDGKTLATGSWDGTIRLWDLAKGAELRSLKGHQGRISDLSFSPDGNFLASSSSIDGSVRVWDPATGLNTCEMKLDQQDVNSVVFSPDGALLIATLGSDMSQFVRLPPIQLLNHNNCTTVRSLGNLKPFSKPALFATFSADGSHLASVSNDGDLHLWSISLVKLLRSTRAPSPRAALISETLQRLWGLRMEGLTVVRDNWNDLFPRGGYYTNQLVTVDTRTVEEAADPNTPPILRTFDIRPLLDPPTPDKDKLDQLLDWLAEQERLEPRLRAQ
jgi:WD40 repeat protein